MKIKSLATLKKEASQATAARGHRMRWNAPYGRANGPCSQYGECKCGAWVQIDQKPAPNGIEIGGPALSLNH